jgi:signal transduction histidine kinase
MGLLFSISLVGLYARAKDKRIPIYAFIGLVLFLTSYQEALGYLICIAFLLGGYHHSKGFILTSLLVFLWVDVYTFIPFLLFSLACGYLLRKNVDLEDLHYHALDEGRRTIYELETAKSKLKTSQDDLISMTALNERNRIARSIHDNLGHKLVGSKMLLEAAYSIQSSDQDKAQVLIERVIGELTESVDLLRETVHDLSPNQDVGMGHIKNLIKKFHFCPIHLETKGDLNGISSGVYAVIQLNLKEALTNVSKYSTGDRVDVTIESTKKYTRFSIRDNGHGKDYINEGLGITGMRERVNNIGGTFTLDYQDGFKLYMFFPRRE